MVFTINGRGRHLGNVTKILCIKSGLVIIKRLHMEYEFIFANCWRENCLLYIDGTPI